MSGDPSFVGQLGLQPGYFQDRETDEALGHGRKEGKETGKLLSMGVRIETGLSSLAGLQAHLPCNTGDHYPERERPSPCPETTLPSSGQYRKV